MLQRRLLHAEVVYNGLGTPRRDGAAVVQDDGTSRRIVAVDGLHAARAAFPDAELEDAGFALSPPPVNAHTHLDLSGLPYAERSYEAFVGEVVRHGREGRRGLDAARDGAGEVLAGGVRVIGDIVTDERVLRFLLGHEELRGVAYWEVYGLDPGGAGRILDDTRRLVERVLPLQRPGGMRLGLSPHTPHTVSPELMRGLVALAREAGLPLQIHAGESPGEARLYRGGDGPLADLLRRAGASFRPAGTSPVRHLAELGVLEARPTLVHMVEVDDEDVRAVQRCGSVVVHCPRSNRTLGCRRFPWELYARHGVDVALGTDSRGSSPTLSVVDEALAALAVHGERVSPQALVRAAVKGGYRALGLEPPRVVRGDPADALMAWPVSTIRHARGRPAP